MRRTHKEACQKQLGLLERQRAELIARREETIATRAAASQAALSPQLHDVFASYWARIEGELSAMAQDQATVETHIEKARQDVIDAHREVRTVEKLQERDRNLRLRAEDRRERRRSNELAGYRHAAASHGETAS